ncbi:MAG: hypothetical protein DRH37_11055 [Deltaproteobacteria bacterium]|nr:MAG: hypothetical protein DRH37_11055 [Deltaproteobacteria bacterium]
MNPFKLFPPVSPQAIRDDGPAPLGPTEVLRPVIFPVNHPCTLHVNLPRVFIGIPGNIGRIRWRWIVSVARPCRYPICGIFHD